MKHRPMYSAQANLWRACHGTGKVEGAQRVVCGGTGKVLQGIGGG